MNKSGDVSKPSWRCGSCKFRRENKFHGFPGICERIKGPQHLLDDESVLEDEIAIATDGSGYLAEVEVKDDFGCVLWEPKT